MLGNMKTDVCPLLDIFKSFLLISEQRTANSTDTKGAIVTLSRLHQLRTASKGLRSRDPAKLAQFFFFLAHLASTALRPWSLSSCFVNLAALAVPPFLPKATACGSLRLISRMLLRTVTNGILFMLRSVTYTQH